MCASNVMVDYDPVEIVIIVVVGIQNGCVHVDWVIVVVVDAVN